jgi:hypothetical protein
VPPPLLLLLLLASLPPLPPLPPVVPGSVVVMTQPPSTSIATALTAVKVRKFIRSSSTR